MSLQGPPLFSLKNISRSYSKHGFALDLRNLPEKKQCLDIPAGCVVAIMGYSGSGKSTLLNLLALLDEPSIQNDASLKYLGQELLGLPESEACSLRQNEFGFAFQQAHHVYNLSTEQNLLLPMMLQGQTVEEGALNTLVKGLKLEEKDLSLSPGSLSQGESHRVALGRALLHGPKVIFADEPEGNLDPETGHQVLQQLKQWTGADSDKRRSVLWVTHNLDLAAQFADHLLVLRGGKLSYSGPLPAQGQPLEIQRGELLKTLGMVSGPREGLAPSVALPKTIPHNRASIFWNYAKSDLWANGKSLWQKAFITPTLSIALMMVLCLLTWKVIGGVDRYFSVLLEEAAISRVSIGPQNSQTGESVSLDQNAIDRIQALVQQDQLPLEGIYGLRHSRLYIAGPNQSDRSKAFPGLMLHPEDPYLKTISNHKDLELTCDTEFSIPKRSPSWEQDKRRSPQNLAQPFKNANSAPYGIIVTQNLLCKMAYNKVPDTIRVEALDGWRNLPVLGVTDSLLHGEYAAPYPFYLESLYGGRSQPRFTELHAYLSNPLEAESALETLIEAGFDPDRRPLELARWVQNVMTFLAALGLGGMISTILICLANVSLVFKGLAHEKRRDIGMLRAIGATRTDILKLYSLEGFIIWAGAALITSGLLLLTSDSISRYLLNLLEVPADRAADMAACFELNASQFICVLAGGFLVTLIACNGAVASVAGRKPAHVLKEG